MNRALVVILIFLALCLVAYNLTLVDFENPFQGDSTVALIGVVAPLCAIVLLLIFTTSKKIDNTLKKD